MSLGAEGTLLFVAFFAVFFIFVLVVVLKSRDLGVEVGRVEGRLFTTTHAPTDLEERCTIRVHRHEARPGGEPDVKIAFDASPYGRGIRREQALELARALERAARQAR